MQQASLGTSGSLYLVPSFSKGEGLIGRAAEKQEPLFLESDLEHHIRIKFDHGTAIPGGLAVYPLKDSGRVIAVVEIATVLPLEGLRCSLLERIARRLGPPLRASATRAQDVLLGQITEQSQRLEKQQVSLHRRNAKLQDQQTQLESSNDQLASRSESLMRQTSRVEEQKRQLEDQKKELVLSNKYKSESLSNMSHELRSPINSMLILSKYLAENEHDNLSTEEVEAASIVHSSGSELLELINEILDLSKVEAGMMEVIIEPAELDRILGTLGKQYSPAAKDKGIGLCLKRGESTPREIQTDAKRLSQIIKNLISNALKFTADGEVTVEVTRVPAAECPYSLRDAGPLVAFSVTDTGIGIPEDRQAAIFLAFQQADGGINRSYGGTGLGLTISLELASLLGGALRLTSSSSAGSCFTLFLPIEAAQSKAKSSTKPQPMEAKQHDHREQPSLFVVENDGRFASLLCELGTQREFQCVSVKQDLGVLDRTARELPSAILLDLNNCADEGAQLLERLKADSRTSHIPVQVNLGDDGALQPDAQIMELASSIASRGSGSLGEMLEQVTLFLNSLTSIIESNEEAPVGNKNHSWDSLEGRNVLVVDDDKRNIFALRKLLEARGVSVVSAENGQAAIHTLEQESGIDLVLMDVMMPIMDGLEATRRIRERPAWKGLPIISLTAKALSKDRRECLAAGANDYLAKPVDSQELLDLLAMWLLRNANEQ